MSAPAVTTSIDNVDPNQPNPSTIQGLIDILNPLLVSSIQGTFIPYVLSSSTPAVSDQDKVWLQTDGAGRPTKVNLFYNGNWRRFYNGNLGELRMFNGDPTLYFDGTGLGIVGGEWDGWAICNGQNGTDDWNDTFPVSGAVGNGGTTGPSFSSGWQTNVTGTLQATGGAANFMIQNTYLPNMTVQLSGAGNFDTNATPLSTKAAIVTGKYTDSATANTVTVATFGATPDATPAVPQVAVPTVPPFRAICMTQYVGYA